MSWKENFTEREQIEIDWARRYNRDYNHGAIAHDLMNIIAKLANIASQQEREIFELHLQNDQRYENKEGK